MIQPCALAAQKSNSVPGSSRNHVGSREGKRFCPSALLCCALAKPAAVMFPALAQTTKEGHGSQRKLRGGNEGDQRI